MGEEIPQCMGTCGYWQQEFYWDYDSYEEKPLQWCMLKKRAITDPDCLQCDEYECMY